MKYDKRHGGPYDRGGADYWYHRPCAPHHFLKGSYTSDRVERDQMTTEEVNAYRAGYREAKEHGDQKDWG
jgi:hypothetical protein